MHALLQQRLQVHVPVIELFKYPTVRALALYLGQAEPPQAVAAQPDAHDAASRRREALLQRKRQLERIL
jgi:hypothetical protein